MRRLKLIYIISDIDKAMPFEWISVRLMVDFNLSFILIGKRDPQLRTFLVAHNIPTVIISDDEFPSHWSKTARMFKILQKERPDIIHTHLWRANLIAQPVAWILRIKERIFTRHHAVIHYTEHPSGRKWDRLVNFLATQIIAISQNVKEILVTFDKADPGKITIIRHGFDLKYFSDVPQERIEDVKRRLRIPVNAYPIIGIISRYLQWKGVHHGIDAFAALLKNFPNAHLVLANTQGNFAKEIQKHLGKLPSKSYTEVFYEHDVAALYHIFNVYVHVPLDRRVEAFGQTYVEALASGIPSVFTMSGVAPEFIVEGQNAVRAEFESSESIKICIEQLLKDANLREKLSKNGISSVQAFSLDKMLSELKKVYVTPKALGHA